eukprot:scaffold2004_cov420-Prasinococcus_capsulatus_cf.AAC.7
MACSARSTGAALETCRRPAARGDGDGLLLGPRGGLAAASSGAPHATAATPHFSRALRVARRPVPHRPLAAPPSAGAGASSSNEHVALRARAPPAAAPRADGGGRAATLLPLMLRERCGGC